MAPSHDEKLFVSMKIKLFFRLVLPALLFAGCATESSRPIVAVKPELPLRDQFYNVRAFGAVGDGQTLDSPAINKAIDACAAAGGGTVLFPAGTYLCGSIHLKSNIHLLIDAGATILGAPQAMNAYDPKRSLRRAGVIRTAATPIFTTA